MAARAATGFRGWPPEALEFLEELEANNDRDWFKANRGPAGGRARTGRALVRAPGGSPADHPRLDLLRRRRLTVARRHDLRKWLHRPEAGSRIREGLEAAVPLVRW